MSRMGLWRDGGISIRIFWKCSRLPRPLAIGDFEALFFFLRVERGPDNSSDDLVSGVNLYLNSAEDSSGIGATGMVLSLSSLPALCSYLILALKPFLVN